MKQDKAPNDIFIYDLYLSNQLTTRVYNVLTRMNVSTIEDLSNVTADNILSQKGAGENTVKRVANLLAQYNLSLSDNNVPVPETVKTEEVKDVSTFICSLSVCSLSEKARNFLMERIQKKEDVENPTVLKMLIRELNSSELDPKIKMEICEWLWKYEDIRHDRVIEALKKAVNTPIYRGTDKIPVKAENKQDISLADAFINYMNVSSYYKLPIGLKTTVKFLKRENITTLGEVAQYRARDLMKMRWIGEWSVRMIREVLKLYNMYLKGEEKKGEEK